jgi:hypothetical protein
VFCVPTNCAAVMPNRATPTRATPINARLVFVFMFFFNVHLGLRMVWMFIETKMKQFRETIFYLFDGFVLGFSQCFSDLFPMCTLPVDLLTVGASPELIIVEVGVLLQIVIKFILRCLLEFGVAEWTMRIVHIYC